jgi:AraC family transcriptional regulator
MVRENGWRGRPARSALEWPGMRSHYAWLPPHAEASTTGAHQVGVSFSAHTALERRAGGRTVRGDIPPGTAFITGPDAISWLGVAEPTEALEIYPDPGLLAGVGFGTGRPCIEPAAGVRDGVVFAVASLLKRAHVTGAELSDIEASTLSHRLVEHLGHVYQAGARAGAPPAGTLGPATLDRVVQYVHAYLAGPITLDRLAALAALSPYHFARAFKSTTGMPPHRFVTATRLETAKAALVGSPRPVTEVAQAVGFGNVSHFRRLFHREFGLRPAQLRPPHRRPQPGTAQHRKNRPSPSAPGCVTVAR